MLESGHFKDLEMILDCMSITQKAVINEWTHPNSGSNNAKENKNEDEDDDNDNDDDDDENGDGSNDQQQPKLLELDANGEIKMESMTKAQLRHQHRRRTFLFSATLLPLDSFSKKKKKKNSKSKSNSSSGTIVKSQDGADVRTLGIKNYRRGDSIDNNPMTIHPTFIVDELVKRIQFCDPNPLFIDVISKNTSTSTGDDESSDFQQKTSRLVESKIDCLIKDKDLFLYYILMMYPGRSLVFVNSIDCIRRLVPLLSLLNVNVWGLHAEMQQRQRLKNLER